MVFLPKLRQHIMVSAAHAFHMRRFNGVQPAWAVAATRPIAAREVWVEQPTARRLKIRHLRLLFGLACLLLLLAILLTQPMAAGSAPYLTYDRVSAAQVGPLTIDQPHSGGPASAAPCPVLAAALNICEP